MARQLELHSKTLSPGKENESQVWWCIPIIPAPGRQKQADPCAFEASLLFIVSSGTARAIE